ncbi:MAG: tetratricopeptide repeat protein, partial [Bacteroidales bacterium]|nr:tetratricopeptide repeat protein [Bacteroidales bacterium]
MIKKYLLYIIITIISACNQNLLANEQSAIDSLNIKLKTSKEQEKAKIYNNLSDLFLYISVDSSLEKANKAKIFAEKTQNNFELANALYNIGICFYFKGELNSTLEYCKKAHKIFKEINKTEETANSLTMIGIVYYYQGNYYKTIESYQEALKIYEQEKNKKQIASLYNNIGNVYFDWAEMFSEYEKCIDKTSQNYKKSLEYFNKSLDIYLETKNEKGQASLYNNIANIYKATENYNEALDYYNKSIAIKKKFNDSKSIAISLSNIGSIYSIKKETKKALDYFYQSLSIYKKEENKNGLALVLNNIGDIYVKTNDENQAIKYLNESLEISKQINYNETIFLIYKSFSELYLNNKKYKKSLRYYKKYYTLKDSIFNKDSHKQITELQTQYDTEIKEKKIQILSKDQELQNIILKKQKTHKLILFSGIILFLFLSLYIFSQYREKKKTNLSLIEQKNEILDKNEDLSQQKEEILSQRDLIEEKSKNIEKAFATIEQKNKNITDSINYAQKIQTALLPPQHYLDNILNDYFILFKPKDIVSGDFYWVRQKENKIIVAVADCTGHGVPGAFMSILGTTFLNEINHLNSNIEANEILNILSRNLKETLHQTDIKYDTRDGMDIALYIIDTDKQTLQFSGAYNPLYLIRNKELCQYKA